MTNERKQQVRDFITLCVEAKEKGVVLFLVDTGDPEMNSYCCSSADSQVIAAMVAPEVSNLACNMDKSNLLDEKEEQ